MKPAVEQAIKTDAGQKLLENRHAILEMLNSEAFQIWGEWAGQLVAAHKHNALYGATPEEREENRLQAIALEKFQGIPKLLGTILDESSAEAAPLES